MLRHVASTCKRAVPELARMGGSRWRFGGYMQTTKLNEEERPPRILLTGALGQIGTELIPFLQAKYGIDNVISSDVKNPQGAWGDGPFVYADVQDIDQLARVVLENRVTWIMHLASLLSAVAEQNPILALKINTRGIENILELAKQNNLRVYAPSSIAAFGPTTPRTNTPDITIQRPTTMYGVTKVYYELLGEYYHEKFGVDFRSLRYPGIISTEALPGGGTTDYAVEIYHKALTEKKYTCFIEEDQVLPMMFMPDCLEATSDVMAAPRDSLTQCTYNVQGISFSPRQLAESIQKFIPEFTIEYQPDFRQSIADTWPRSLDDSLARRDWNWKARYDIDKMTEHMLTILEKRLLESRS